MWTGKHAPEHAIFAEWTFSPSSTHISHPLSAIGTLASFATCYVCFTMCIHTSTPLLAAQVDALDFFVPKSNRYQDISSPVKHKQSWSTWRGLSSAHAEDLAFCELEFRRAIQAKVAAYADGFLDYSAKQDSVFTVKVNLHELATDIADVYHTTSQLASPLLSLHGLIQFIRLHDCFVRPTSMPGHREPLKARILVKMSQNSTLPVIVAYTPRLVFDDLVVHVQQGQNYYLKPRYSPVFTSLKHTECNPQVTYTTTCEWLRYNKDHNYFAGTVPRSNGAAQKIEVKATVVYHFPDTNIAHEEIIRAVVKFLHVTPSAEFEHPAYVKHVSFASDEHELKTRDVHHLRSRNSFSVLENCSNMDQNRRLMTPPSMSDDVTDAPWPPTSGADEVVLSPSRLVSAQKWGPESIDVGLQSFHKQSGTAEACPEPEKIHDGIEGFYNSFGYGATESGDDGVATQIGKNMRKACQVEFAPDEDPRDVREMKKELMQMELDDLSKSMLGFRVDRWSSEGFGELSDVQEMSDASELENTLRESICY
jgi:hypothetical protein